jgi:hypothetical protein
MTSAIKVKPGFRLAELDLERERFDQIDTNHDGTLDAQERAAWREKQRENYRQQTAETRPADGRAALGAKRR